MKERLISGSILVGMGLVSAALILSTYVRLAVEYNGFNPVSLQNYSPGLVIILYMSYISIGLGILIMASTLLKKRQK